MRSRQKLVSLLALGFFLNAGHEFSAECAPQKSYLDLVFKVTKLTYQVGEPLIGTIEVRNGYPGPIPVIFDITLFHDGQALAPFSTSLSAPQGTTNFTFKQFGIPDFTLEDDSVGLWRIAVLQQNTDPSSAREILIRVKPAPPAASSRNLKKFNI